MTIEDLRPEYFADLDMARRLELTEARSNIEFVEARARLSPASQAGWIQVGGASVMYDGVDSPCTQTFGLGMAEPLTAAHLDRIESFYAGFGAPVFHEVSPLAGVETLQLLSRRGYRPVELTSIMFRPLTGIGAGSRGIAVRVVGPDEYETWARTAAEGWSELVDYADLIYDLALVTASRCGALSFQAEIDGRPVATGGLSIVNDIALLTGASTIPSARRQGAQRALLNRRLEVAVESGCRLAMIGAAPGSVSQHNAEREGFRIAYTRIKWELVADKGRR